MLGIAYILYKDLLAKMLNVEPSMVGKAVIYGVAIPNGVPEAIAAVLIITPIVQALRKLYKTDFNRLIGYSGQGGFLPIFYRKGVEVMILVIDIGNTNAVLGVYSGSKLVTSWRLTTDRNKTGDELGILVMDLFRYSKVTNRI